MPEFIKLTMKVNGRPVWFNHKLITYISETSDGSAIIYSVGSDARCVRETPTEVFDTIRTAEVDKVQNAMLDMFNFK